MNKNEKRIDEYNEDPFQTKEDLFQKSLHGEADFYKGLARYQYKSVWMFLFAFLIALFISFAGLVCISIVIASAISAVKQHVSMVSFIPGGIFALFLGVLIILIAYKLLKSLVHTFSIKEREFKIKAIALLIIPFSIFILICVLILKVIFTMDITF